MSFRYPVLLAIAVLLGVGLVLAYRRLQRQQPTMLRRRFRRHVPPLVFLSALVFLLVGAARPQATVKVPRVSGTVILAFDVSNSMAAKDIAPTRLAAAQAAAKQFVEEQPGTVDVGVLVFGDQALLTQAPSDDHQAALAAISRLSASGGTSLGQAILVALGTITGKSITLPEQGAAPPDLGYWPSATIVVFSDGQETGGPDVVAAAELAAAAGVRIQTVGVGTERGATVEVDGFQLGTALDPALLTTVAQTTGGAYLPAGDADALTDTTKAIDLRLTAQKEPLELTAPFAGAALLLLMLGAVLGSRWHGRII